MIYSLTTSILLNIISILLILGIDYLNAIGELEEKRRIYVGYVLLGLFSISLIVLLLDIVNNIIHFNENNTKTKLIQIICIFVSNILTFSIGYYGLYLIGGDHITFSNASGTMIKTRNYHITNFINIILFTYLASFTITLNDVNVNTNTSKLFLSLQTSYSIVITLFFINNLVSLDLSEIKMPSIPKLRNNGKKAIK
jgi:hypothetical protein